MHGQIADRQALIAFLPAFFRGGGKHHLKHGFAGPVERCRLMRSARPWKRQRRFRSARHPAEAPAQTGFREPRRTFGFLQAGDEHRQGVDTSLDRERRNQRVDRRGLRTLSKCPVEGDRRNGREGVLPDWLSSVSRSGTSCTRSGRSRRAAAEPDAPVLLALAKQKGREPQRVGVVLSEPPSTQYRQNLVNLFRRPGGPGWSVLRPTCRLPE